MKKRVTLTLDPEVSARAKYLARSRHTSVSGLVESLLKQASDSGLSTQGNSPTCFVQRWLGRLHVTRRNDPRADQLKKKYSL